MEEKYKYTINQHFQNLKNFHFSIYDTFAEIMFFLKNLFHCFSIKKSSFEGCNLQKDGYSSIYYVNIYVFLLPVYLY